jgi:superoxide dismutase, Cu-Zn family
MGIRSVHRATTLTAAVLLASGCASTAAPTPVQRAHLEGYTVPPRPALVTAGTFRPWSDGATAVTYDPAVVPAGATATVTVTPGDDGTRVRLAVSGMAPRRSYGAHLHTGVCTAEPSAAGPHYQHIPDPEANAGHPSVNPAYANPANEVWLDFRTGVSGTAIATAAESWTFDEMHPPRSLVIHAGPTHTTMGTAGTAGPRAACLTLTQP